MAMQLTDTLSIKTMIHALGDVNDSARWQARQLLVAQGRDIVPQLISALSDPRIIVRWETTRILAALRDPSAASALVIALTDDDSGVRWSAVYALIALKERAIAPLLRGLTHVQSVLILDGAHHVFKNIPLSQETQTILSSVFNALDGPAPKLQVPIAARIALAKLGQQ